MIFIRLIKLGFKPYDKFSGKIIIIIGIKLYAGNLLSGVMRAKPAIRLPLFYALQGDCCCHAAQLIRIMTGNRRLPCRGVQNDSVCCLVFQKIILNRTKVPDCMVPQVVFTFVRRSLFTFGRQTDASIATMPLNKDFKQLINHYSASPGLFYHPKRRRKPGKPIQHGFLMLETIRWLLYSQIMDYHKRRVLLIEHLFELMV